MSLKSVDNSLNVNNIAVEQIFTDKEVGETIRSVTAEQISEIAKKMSEILSQGVKIDENIRIPKAFVQDDMGFRVIYSYAKTEYLNRAVRLFEQTMRSDFSRGENSFFFEISSKESTGGIYYNYSCEDILKIETSTGGAALREAIGNQLPSDYRIKLTLDLTQTREKSKLVFLVREFRGEEEAFRNSFTLDPHI